MRNKKKLLILILFACFVFTGCATKSSKTQVQFASWGSQSEIAILKPILAEFEKENPDIKVDFVHIPQNYFQKIHLLFASNLAPDVIFINNLYLPFYANAGVLENLNSYSHPHPEFLELVPRAEIHPSPLKGEGRKVKNGSVFYPKALQALSYQGKLYAIPRDISNLVIFYNKDLFKKYNVPFPNKYWTFNDFLITAQKLTKDTNNDGKTDIWGMSFEETPSLFYLPYLMSEGGGVLSDDTKNFILDDKKSQKGLRFYADLRNKYHVAPTKSESASATMAQLFLQGKVAMQLSGRWLVPKYSTDANFSWSVINFPAGDKGSIVPLDASGWAIAKSSKHKPEAKRLIDFLSSKESIEKFSQSGLIVPARIDVAQGEFLSPKSNKDIKLNNEGKNSPYSDISKINKIFVDVIEKSKPTPVSKDYNQIQDKIDKKTNYLFNNN